MNDARLHARGGKREGAGRKRELKDGQTVAVVLEQAQLEYVDEARGEMSRSAFFRQLVDEKRAS